MAWMLAAAAGMQALGGILGGKKAKKAAAIREAAYGDASNIVSGAYDAAMGDIDPRFQQERAAIGRMNELMGFEEGFDPAEVFRSTPGYQFALDQGRQARERSAAAAGGLNSGNTLAALEEYGQGLADQTFQQYLANTMALQSQGADTTRMGLNIDRGNALADLRLGAAGARASGVEGKAAALSGALAGGARLLGGAAGGGGGGMGGGNPLAGTTWRRPALPGATPPFVGYPSTYGYALPQPGVRMG